jgi:hypothetical protein
MEQAVLANSAAETTSETSQTPIEPKTQPYSGLQPRPPSSSTNRKHKSRPLHGSTATSASATAQATADGHW